MTPLAAYLAGQVVTRPKYRKHMWAIPENAKILRADLEDVHCFEMTKCQPLVDELADMLAEQTQEKLESILKAYSFLPAPKTWIEWRYGDGRSAAILLVEAKHKIIRSRCTLYCREEATVLGILSATSSLPADNPVLPKWLTDHLVAYGAGTYSAEWLLILAQLMLLLINSPRIIGRRQVMPNKGLERKLTQGLGVGKFPLHAWTEILLQVSKPPEIDDGEPHEAHLTGRRALHFVRKHIRIRLGQLEYVTAHWRGDPALGIKQSRYTVTP